MRTGPTEIPVKTRDDVPQRTRDDMLRDGVEANDPQGCSPAPLALPATLSPKGDTVPVSFERANVHRKHVVPMS